MKPTQWTQRYGNTALVTGASSGIGEQFARQLAARGFNLLLTARREPQLAALKDELQREYGVTVSYQLCDLSDPAQVTELIALALAAAPGLLVSNAGYGVPKGAYLSIEPEALDAMYQANSLAPARIARALLPSMVERQRGGIIFTGSIEGDAVMPWSTAYAASKAFLHSLVLGLWLEVKSSGVDILLLAPGATDTDAPLKQGIRREQLVGLMSPALVVQQALEQLGRQPQFIPGWRNRLLVAVLRLLPRKTAINMAGIGMQRAIGQSAATD